MNKYTLTAVSLVIFLNLFSSVYFAFTKSDASVRRWSTWIFFHNRNLYWIK
jgi:hypothetical protein